MKYVLASNWKANFTLQEAIEWFDKVDSFSSNLGNIRIVAAVPYPYIYILLQRYNKVEVFSQNLSHVIKGAYTGEVTISMLKSVGFRGSIVGHSERRHIFKEDDEIINKKILILQENQADIIFCIGETLEQRESGKTEETLYFQIKKGLEGFNSFNNLIVAYEPVWAIGTGVPIKIEDLLKIENFIRNIFLREYKVNDLVLLYGGSVDKDFIKLIKKETTLNGALVGSASWNAHNFIQIIGNFIS